METKTTCSMVISRNGNRNNSIVLEFGFLYNIYTHTIYIKIYTHTIYIKIYKHTIYIKIYKLR